MDLGDRLIESDPLGLTDGARSIFRAGFGVAPGGSRLSGADRREASFGGKRRHQTAGGGINNLNINTHHPDMLGFAI